MSSCHDTRTRRLLAAFLVVLCVAPAGASRAASRPAERARHVMVAGPEPMAVEAGLQVLRQGGNAVDAAVTMGFVLAVTYPQAGNIGGGGYMLIRPPGGEAEVIDYRETAPLAATRGMFLDSGGNVVPEASRTTYKAAGVPGTVAGLALALERHGSLPLRRAIAPAVRLAREGFVVGRGLAAAIEASSGRMMRYPASRAIFFRNGVPLREGDRLVQKDLADTLAAIAREGPAAFYRGSIARALAADMAAHEGLITEEDLAAYEPLTRPPVTGVYRSWEVLSAPPSTSGGIALIETLNMLEPYDLRALGHNSSAYVHLVSEAMKRAFADRARWLGDPAFVNVPSAALLSRDYAASLMKGFDPRRATPAPEAGPGDPFALENTSTTHFSIVDADGGAVANTYTLNDWFGCGAVAGSLGFFLNNEMDDFSVKPGEPNMYRLVGGEANSIAPRKRMLSSMAPAMAVGTDDDGRKSIRLVLGSPGGPAIISSVLQTLLNVLEFGMDLQAAVNAPRFHHQWNPDTLFLDEGEFPADVRSALASRGHDVVERGPRGDVQAVGLDPDGGWLLGASDARGYGVARGY